MEEESSLPTPEAFAELTQRFEQAMKLASRVMARTSYARVRSGQEAADLRRRAARKKARNRRIRKETRRR